MCGIAGIFCPSELEQEIDGRLDSALAKMKHRGPNDKGSIVLKLGQGALGLGHTRLSILDLSQAGHQPMFSKDRRFGMIYNGEIYNFRELRHELQALGYIFHSASDSEVLLAAWREWGKKCLPKLVGMFAFAIYDREQGTVTCVRDAFGIKPLFIRFNRGIVHFASEIPAILALSASRVNLNWQKSYDYLVHGTYDNNQDTFFDDIFHLQPHHLMTFQLGTGVCPPQQSWWEPTFEEDDTISFAEAVERVRVGFLTNIRNHLRSDVSLGAALSGGIDSSSVVCAIRHIEPKMPINTFSYIAGAGVVSEEYYVDAVNTHVGAVAHKVAVTPDELFADLKDMIIAQGEPFGSTSIYAQYRVFKLARECGFTVILDGQGADEMLAGYNGYPGQRIRSLLEQNRFLEAASFLNEWAKWPGRSHLEGLKRVVAEQLPGSVYEAFRHLNGMASMPSWIEPGPLAETGVRRRYPRRCAASDAVGRRLVAELAVSLTSQGLPQLLRHADRNSMCFSVESRVPFLTIDFVNLLLSLPESYLISPKGETKSVFRSAMSGIVPNDVLERRDKIAFATPEQDWILARADIIRPWLLEDIDLAFLRHSEMLKEFDAIVQGKRPFSWQVWRWINFTHWYKHFF